MSFWEGLNLFYLWLALFAVTRLIEASPYSGDSQAEDYPDSISAFVLFVLRLFILYPVLVLLWGYLLICAFGFALIILIGISFRLDKQLWQRKEVQHLLPRVIKVLRWLMYGSTLILTVFSVWIFGLDETAFTLFCSQLCLSPILFFIIWHYGFKFTSRTRDWITFFVMLGLGITVYIQVLLVFEPINWDEYKNLAYPPCYLSEDFKVKELEIAPTQVSFQSAGLNGIQLTGKFEYYATYRSSLTISSDSRHLVWSPIQNPQNSSRYGANFTYVNRYTGVEAGCSPSQFGYDVQQNIEPIFIDYAQARIYTTTSTKLGRLESTKWSIRTDGSIVHSGLSAHDLFYVMEQNQRAEVRCGRDENVAGYVDIYPAVYRFLTSQSVINPLLGANFDLYSVRLDCLGENLIIVTSRGTFLFEVDT